MAAVPSRQESQPTTPVRYNVSHPDIKDVLYILIFSDLESID
jgi:hypothetical protein